MSQTFFATNDASTQKLWEQGCRLEMENDSVFGKYGSENGSLPIEIDRTMTGKKGDNITTTLMYDLDDNKVYTSSQTIEGKEQKATTKTFSVSLETYDMPVSAGHQLSNQRVAFEISEKVEQLLKKAGARRLDRVFTESMTGASTTETTATGGDFTKVFMPNATLDALSALNTAAGNLIKVQGLTANDKISFSQIGKAKAFAKTGGYTLSTGLRVQPKFPHITGAGPEGFLCFIHPDVGFDMRRDGDINQMLRDAQMRGNENPLFTGAAFELDGITFIESDLVPLRKTGGSGAISYALNFMVGAQAFFYAWGQELKVYMYKTDAYGRFVNYALNYMAGWGKAKYNSLDFSVIGMPCACTNISAQ